MMNKCIHITSLCILLRLVTVAHSSDANNGGTCPSSAKNMHTRYLLYTVNYGEGFNLRRDVYVRMANLVHKLRTERCNEDWILVLPPWHRIYHWFNSRTSAPVPWAQFFDLESFSRYVPVIELDQYINETGRGVDQVHVLQHYAEGWGDGWEEKHHVRPCIQQHEFRQVGSVWEGTISGRLLHAAALDCISVQGTSSTLVPLVTSSSGSSIVVARAETVLHDHFAGAEYWTARRSMRFARTLVARANTFRIKNLNSTDEADGTLVPHDWRKQTPAASKKVKGGPYLSVHLRRRDFLRAKGDELPTIRHAAKQMQKLLQQLHLDTLFLATDADQEDVSELVTLLQPKCRVVRYSGGTGDRLSDGELAVVDQIIASHARHFIGSHESTFSYRIQDEREILGFAADSTFNRLCGKRKDCQQPARWTIVY
uniref:GDP-fucose protein O-fucosyltransferase 2 n=1 Tax=Hirondellea gigas TaxID=1518452 RepID=A0A2P2I6C8_9CRUS